MDNNQLFDGLLDAMVERLQTKQVDYKHDLPTGFTIGTNWMHGPTGIFGPAGSEPTVFATRVTPRGILGNVPALATVDTNPLVPYLTGFTDETGTEPTYPCDEPPAAGSIKSCYQGTIFGHIQRKTQVLELNKVGRRTNRGEFFDLRLVNPPLLAAGFSVPPSIPGDVADILNNEVWSRWITLGVAFENKLGPMMWTGTPNNNTAGNGYMEFLGLEGLVTTGHVDVITNTSCPSLDSDIKDFNYQAVETAAHPLFLFLTMMYRFVKHNAETMNMMPVEWAVVMQDALFRIICDFWPCVYANARCTSGGNANSILQANIDAQQAREMADAMYNGRFLWLDGQRVPVWIDDYIPYDTNATNQRVPRGSFASDIYILPYRVKMGMPVLYMEYFDYSAPNGVSDAIRDGGLSSEFWTDGGRWLWTFSKTNWCVTWLAKIEPRLRLLTPHLAGRLMNVVYTPLQMFRMPHPDDAYFVDGGNVARTNYVYDYTDLLAR